MSTVKTRPAARTHRACCAVAAPACPKLANQVQKANLVRYPDTRSALDRVNQVREFRTRAALDVFTMRGDRAVPAHAATHADCEAAPRTPPRGHARRRATCAGASGRLPG